MNTFDGVGSEQADWLFGYLSLSDNALMFADHDFVIRFANKALIALFSEVETELKALFSFFDVSQLVGQSIDRFHQHPERIRQHLSLLQATWSSDLHLGSLLFKLIVTPLVINQVRVGYVVQWKEQSAEAELIQQIDTFIQQVKGNNVPVLPEDVVNRYYLNLLSQDSSQTVSAPLKSQFIIKQSLQNLVDHIQSFTQQEVQTERVNTIGFMATGVAHEINNPIAGVLANLMYLKSVSTSDQDVIEESLVALTRVSEIAKGLLSFTRGDSEAHQTCEPMLLSSAMMQVLQLLALQLRSNPAFGQVVIEPQIPDELAELNLLINKNDFIHILLNVIDNAVDALSEAGIEHPKVEISAVLSEDGHFIELRITDNGLGVPKPLQNKIFMPFFTTKAQGKGTGMGLALVLNLAKSCGAQFFLDTGYQQGARFVLRVAVDYDNKYLDIACLNKIKSALSNDFSSIIKTFIAQGEREIRYMKSACNEQKFDLLYEDVHRLKGMSASVCAKLVYQSCVALRALLNQTPDANLITQETLQLEQYFQETIPRLKKLSTTS